MGLRAERLKTEHPLDDLPLVVLARGIAEENGPDGRALEEEHKTDQAVLATLSRHGEQLTAAQSGHHVQLDEPQLVITAIRRVVAAARK